MSASQRPEVELAVLQGASGSPEDRDRVWLEVFTHFQPRLTSFFATRVPAPDELDEVLGEIWARAFLFIRTLHSSAALWNWLTTIGNNVIRDRRRRANRRPETAQSDLDERSKVLESFLAGLALDPFGSTSETAQVSLLALLTSEDREFLELIAIDGLSHEAVAHRLKLTSAAASRQRLRRLRKRLLGARDTGRQ
jgi:DNA-directed RNA polymerase specialized sigma24 family protein